MQSAPAAPGTEHLRNIGVVAHIDAGKTTVSERMLFFAGVEHKLGEVDEGTTTLDWMPEERERGITITAAATTIPWRGHSINLIDTPGHVDFTIEVERSLRVLDGAVLVLDAVAGVQAQSETVWRQMRRHNVPAVCFVNKCDRAGADFLAAVATLGTRLGARGVPIQYPLYGPEGTLSGVIDLLTMQALEFPADAGAPPEARAVPEALVDEVGVLRAELVDTLAEQDDELIACVLEERTPTVEALRAALRARTMSCDVLPVLCGAALRNIGVQPIMDAVIDYLPSPADLPPVVGREPSSGQRLELPAQPGAPLCALVFKVYADRHGELCYLRVYSGAIESGQQLYNPRTQKVERVARLLRMHADARTAVEVAGPGEVVAVTGLKFTGTGDTLCTRAEPIQLEGLVFPEPVISLVVEPRSTGDRDKLRLALERLSREDPSFHAREDEDTGQWLVAGMGELHLEVVMHRLASEYNVEVASGAPRVAYRETVREAGRGSARVDKVLGGKQVFGAVELELRPAPDTSGVGLEWAPDCPVPAPFRAAVGEALLLSAQVGPRLGYPLVNALVRVTGGESRPRLDAEIGFVQAATAALRQAMAQAQVELQEPVMAFEIEAPAEFTSGIIADLNSRRAEVGGLSAAGPLRSIVGRVPLARMFGYSTAVRSLSQGRASFSMQPAGFRVVPEADLAERGLTWG
jgi:elongation factor G